MTKKPALTSSKSKATPANKEASKEPGPSAPSEQTAKRLFGLSSNRCAYPGCRNPMIDPKFGSVLGEMCHIKGEKPMAARHDKNQSNAERHGFGNLVLMCKPHHKVIDDNPDDFKVEDLLKIKADHESYPQEVPDLSDEQAQEFIAKITGNVIHGSIASSQAQAGGVTAGTFNNSGNVYINPPPPPVDDDVVVEARLFVGGGMEALEKHGTAGLCLDIVCKSKRPAKIRTAMLILEGEGFAEKAHQAFGAEFKGAIPGIPQQLVVEFLLNSTPTNSEGFVLNRDDICHFILPFWPEVLMEFVQGKPDKLSIRAEFFDGSERRLLEGEHVHSTLRTFVEKEVKRGRRAKGVAKIAVKVSATNMDEVIHEGQLNKHGFSFSHGLHPEPAKMPIIAALAVVQKGIQFTLGCMIRNISDKTFDGLIVEFGAMTTEDKTKREIIYFQSEITGPLKPGEQRPFTLPFADTRRVRELVKSLAVGRYVLATHDKKYVYNAIPSEPIKAAVEHMEKVAKDACTNPK